MEAPADVADPTVTQYAAPSRPTGVVLMLHGGKDRGDDVVDSRSASWRRSAAMARSISTGAESAGECWRPPRVSAGKGRRRLPSGQLARRVATGRCERPGHHAPERTTRRSK